LYLTVLAAVPEEPNANHFLAVLRLHQGRFREALTLIGKALAARPEAGELHAHHGLILHSLGRDQEALTSLDKALTLKPGQPEALSSRGMVLKALDRPQEALASLEAALVLEPAYAEAWNNHGVALHALGRFEAALASLDRALALEPDSFRVQFNRGLVCRDLGHCRDAADAFRAVLKAIPHHPESLNNLALALCEADETEEAMAFFQRHALIANTTDGVADPDFKRQHDQEQAAYLAGDALVPDTGSRLSTPAINPDNDVAVIHARWQAARPQILVIDNLLTPAALDALRRFCWQEPVWKKSYDNGYLGARPEHGFAAPLLAQIADELRQTYGAIFGAHPLRYLWAFKCDSHLKGVNVHADFAAVNVNFWITPDQANLEPERGGLVLWDVAAPLDWDFDTYNNDEPAIRRFLAEKGARSITVPYRANRAVIFDSDLFHETDRIAFREGYTNRRINITMLYGRRRSHEGPAQKRN
jgi:tetratricopeptide (TPR) repeat protein